jgi:uncharacterized protein (TIGR02594 family)
MPTELQSPAGATLRAPALPASALIELTSLVPDPPWLTAARSELGQREQPGNNDNHRILRYYRQAGHPEIQHDEVAWCAAFVGATLEAVGQPSTRSLMARSYLNWGSTLTSGRPGAVAIFKRGGDPNAGHVAFWLGEHDDRVKVLGGNQGDAVSITTMAKADLLGLRWPTARAITTEPATATNTGDALFEVSLAHVLAMEGGWTDDPHDPGGPTNFGITLATLAAFTTTVVTAATFPSLKAELRTLSPATIRTIYFERYWQPCRAASLPPPLALMHFDAAVNHGVGGAARLLQQALGVTVDGDIGPQTSAAAASLPVSDCLETYAQLRRTRYRRLGHFWRFGRGWLARVDATLNAARRLNARMPLTDPTYGVRPMPNTATQSTSPTPPAKWWAHSMTIWGTLITALCTVLPLIGPAIGFDIKPELIRQLGDNFVVVAQAVAGLFGTIMALYGRVTATDRLERRSVTVQI